MDLTPKLAQFLVALITWLGVFAYLVRLDKMTRAMEKQAAAVLARREEEAAAATDDAPIPKP